MVFDALLVSRLGTDVICRYRLSPIPNRKVLNIFRQVAFDVKIAVLALF